MFIFFYFFSILMILASIGVIISRNTVHSVLYLIFALCNAAGLMLLIGAEFLAMILIIVYVGAVAVLFLFVLMMFDMKLVSLHDKIQHNIGLSSFIGLAVLCELLLIIFAPDFSINISNSPGFLVNPEVSNTNAIGKILYTDMILPFHVIGLVLFVAMISCITLTMRGNVKSIKRQNIADQLSKSKDNSLVITKPKYKEGIKDLHYDDN
ncbi:MAG: NADH-quinone oxidoreductase subunit J [Rickettsiaceae bacterium]